MAMTPEGKVKKKLVEYLKAMGVYYFFPATGGFGRSGVPDVVGCYRGVFFGFECKAGDNKPTALQERELDAIVRAHGVATIINEENVDGVQDFIMQAVKTKGLL